MSHQLDFPDRHRWDAVKYCRSAFGSKVDTLLLYFEVWMPKCGNSGMKYILLLQGHPLMLYFCPPRTFVTPVEHRSDEQRLEKVVSLLKGVDCTKTVIVVDWLTCFWA